MLRKLMAFLLMLVGVGVTAPSAAVDLTGTIVNNSGAPAQGLVVKLNGVGLVDTTDSLGRFRLVEQPASAASRSFSCDQGVQVSGDRLRFSVDGGSRQAVRLTLYRPDGRLAERLFAGALPAGRHSLALRSSAVTSGLYLAVLEHGHRSSRIRVTDVGDRLLATSIDTRYGAVEAVPVAGMLRSADTGARRSVLDSLTIIGALDTITAHVPLYRGDLSIRLDPSPEEIVAIALAEESRCPADVGTDMAAYPGALRHYLRRTGSETCDYEAWCSEFVSWAYKAAGLPFTEGRQGGWMYTYSAAIKDWFRRHGRFVDRTDPRYSSFAPAPGDYIRYNNNWGGHSGIVDRVEGSTLYTIEGNIGNVVVRRTIRNFKSRTDIDGFGVVRRTRGLHMSVSPEPVTI